jgi:hypothetical protein
VIGASGGGASRPASSTELAFALARGAARSTGGAAGTLAHRDQLRCDLGVGHQYGDGALRMTARLTIFPSRTLK